MTSEIRKLLQIIEDQLDWGDAAAWQSKDFESLNELIFEKTKVSLSASTLRRVWGRVEYKHLPSGTTLDTLSRFAGFESWRAFLKANSAHGNSKKTLGLSKAKRDIHFSLYLIIAILLFAVVLTGVLRIALFS